MESKGEKLRTREAVWVKTKSDESLQKSIHRYKCDIGRYALFLYLFEETAVKFFYILCRGDGDAGLTRCQLEEFNEGLVILIEYINEGNTNYVYVFERRNSLKKNIEHIMSCNLNVINSGEWELTTAGNLISAIKDVLFCPGNEYKLYINTDRVIGMFEQAQKIYIHRYYNFSSFFIYTEAEIWGHNVKIVPKFKASEKIWDAIDMIIRDYEARFMEKLREEMHLVVPDEVFRYFLLCKSATNTFLYRKMNWEHMFKSEFQEVFEEIYWKKIDSIWNACLIVFLEIFGRAPIRLNEKEFNIKNKFDTTTTNPDLVLKDEDVNALLEVFCNTGLLNQFPLIAFKPDSWEFDGEKAQCNYTGGFPGNFLANSIPLCERFLEESKIKHACEKVNNFQNIRLNLALEKVYLYKDNLCFMSSELIENFRRLCMKFHKDEKVFQDEEHVLYENMLFLCRATSYFLGFFELYRKFDFENRGFYFPYSVKQERGIAFIVTSCESFHDVFLASLIEFNTEGSLNVESLKWVVGNLCLGGNKDKELSIVYFNENLSSLAENILTEKELLKRVDFYCKNNKVTGEKRYGLFAGMLEYWRYYVSIQLNGTYSTRSVYQYACQGEPFKFLF